MARLLDVPRKTVYEIMRSERGRKTLQVIELAGKKRIGTFVIPQCKTMNELLTEYINLYGKNTLALSTYAF